MCRFRFGVLLREVLGWLYVYSVRCCVFKHGMIDVRVIVGL